jgi:hypothetical protein
VGDQADPSEERSTVSGFWQSIRDSFRHAFFEAVAEKIIGLLFTLAGLFIVSISYGWLGRHLEGSPVPGGPAVVIPVPGLQPAAPPVSNPPQAPPPTLPPAQTISLPTGGEAKRFLRVCRDEQGHELGHFSVLVFSDEYQWRCNSDREVLFAGQDVDFAGEVLSSPGLQSYLEADEIVAVGSASCDTNKLVAQECLALRRARRLQGWVRRVRRTHGGGPSLQDVHFLSLGQRRPPAGTTCDLNNCRQTGSQRPVMLLAVNHRESEVPLAPCLLNILGSDPEMNLELNEFSQFELNSSPPVSACTEGGA